jgi:hypothetical protein
MGAILLLIVAWETCLVNPLQHSGFQAARHNIVSNPIKSTSTALLIKGISGD